MTTDELAQVLARAAASQTEISGKTSPGSNPRADDVQAENASGTEEMQEGEVSVDFAPASLVAKGQAITLLDSCKAPARTDRFAVKTGQYPHVRPIYLHQSARLKASGAGEFLEFAMSPNAAPVLAAHGLVDQWLEVFPMNADDTALQTGPEVESGYEFEMSRKLRELRETHERLSSTFYFPSGSSDTDHLDPRQLERLAGYLSNAPKGTRVMVAGFTDDVGRPAKNFRISSERAFRLAEALRAVGGDALSEVVIDAVGFGKLAPVTCNSDGTGRSLNRRVEIWLDKSNSENVQAFLANESD